MKFINKGTIIAAFLGGVTAIVLTVGGVALAHGGAHGGPRGKGGPWSEENIEQHLTEMTEKLGLSTEQEANIRAIVAQAVEQGRELKELPRSKEKFTAMRDLHFATEDQIYANLNCEQREGLRLLKREHKVERMQERFERHHSEEKN